MKCLKIENLISDNFVGQKLAIFLTVEKNSFSPLENFKHCEFFKYYSLKYFRAFQKIIKDLGEKYWEEYINPLTPGFH